MEAIKVVNMVKSLSTKSHLQYYKGNIKPWSTQNSLMNIKETFGELTIVEWLSKGRHHRTAKATQ